MAALAVRPPDEDEACMSIEDDTGVIVSLSSSSTVMTECCHVRYDSILRLESVVPSRRTKVASAASALDLRLDVRGDYGTAGVKLTVKR